MIDWVSAKVPLTWDYPINNGMVVHYRADGSIEYGVDKTLHLKGSFDARFAVRTVEKGFIEIAGNPSKFMQGHNLFGSSDVRGLINDLMERICENVGIEPEFEDRVAWLQGDILLKRIDLTSMRELPSYADVSAWLHAAQQVASVKYRGRGHYQDGTLYFGKVSKGKRASDWQLKLYHKGEEVLVPGHKLPDDLPHREELIRWAANKLRIEVTLRTQELKRLGLAKVSKWTREKVSHVYKAYLGRMDIGELKMADMKLEEELKPSLRLAYETWRTGVDMRSVLTKATFYRYRKNIMIKTGVDIGMLYPKSNVIPLRRYLEPLPVVIPSFAKGTKLLYEPKNRVYTIG